MVDLVGVEHKKNGGITASFRDTEGQRFDSSSGGDSALNLHLFWPITPVLIGLAPNALANSFNCIKRLFVQNFIQIGEYFNLLGSDTRFRLREAAKGFTLLTSSIFELESCNLA